MSHKGSYGRNDSRTSHPGLKTKSVGPAVKKVSTPTSGFGKNKA